jgi:tetratricopeptide (TPR) repeat protein
LLKALRLFKESSDNYHLAITHGTWGSLNRDLSNYPEAESSMREALRIASGLKNAEELKSIMCQKLTKLMIESNRLPEAEDFNTQAEAILGQLRRQVGVAYCKLNRALMAERRNDFNKALDCAKEAETLFVQYGDRREIAVDLQRIQEKATKVLSRATSSR